MLHDLLAPVCATLDIPLADDVNEKRIAILAVGGVEVEVRDLQPGVSFFAKVGSCPVKKREELFMKLMKGNYLGQETGAARIGLSEDEKFLTLSLGMPYEVTKAIFRDALEDFVNFVLYWRGEVEKFENQLTLY